MRIEPDVFIFPVYLGACTAIHKEQPRTWWDKLLSRWRYDYAFAFCSPEDLQNRWDFDKGVAIAENRLALLHTRRGNRLMDKGFAGTLISKHRPVSPLEIHIELLHDGTESAPACWKKIFPVDFSAGSHPEELVRDVHQAMVECEGL
jgi:hypothetical protein